MPDMCRHLQTRAMLGAATMEGLEGEYSGELNACDRGAKLCQGLAKVSDKEGAM